jgi:hypothetical protein
MTEANLNTTPNPAAAPQLFEITVNGETQKLTLDEMKKRAEKASGADQAFRDAARVRSQATDGLSLQAVIDKVKSGQATMADVKAFADKLGIPDADFNELYQEVLTQSAASGTKPAQLVAPAQLTPETQEDLAALREFRVKDMANKMIAESKQVVDNDPIMGIIIKAEGVSPEKRDIFYATMQDEVQRRVLLNEPYGPELLANAAQRVRSRLDKLGVLAAGNQQAVSTALGPSSGGLAALLQANKTVKPAKVTDPDYSENLYLRLAAKLMGRS